LLDEAEAKSLLEQNDVAVPKGRRCDREGVLHSANKLGFPVTLKGLGLAHKSEAGAVAVGIKDADTLQTALAQMPKTIGEFLVEQTITDVVAEVLVSVRRDAPVGWLITLGAGGVMTEIWRDTTCLLAPATDDEIRQALLSLRIAPILRGFRGKPSADLAALVRLVQLVVNMALNNEIVEIELNPVLVTTKSAVAVDALMIVEGP